MSEKWNTPVSRWLKAARVTDTPEGDLIADTQFDFKMHAEQFPALFSNRAQMRDFLKDRRACKEALQAIPGVWRRYRNWLDHHSFG
jgi:hypothetical protein